MQVNHLTSIHPGSTPKDSSTPVTTPNKPTCSSLKNQGAYFTVDVGVGTPSQTFNLVADTGSDALIVPDCRCVEAGYCSTINSCFAPEDSGSFALDEHKDKHNKSQILGAKMDYGSGEIQVLIGSDHVNLAGMKTKLSKGVFLMEDRRELDVHGDFEGILGLGLPHRHPLSKDAVEIPSFMDEATEVTSYSLCFNEWPRPGALRTSSEPLKNPMGNIGQVHWGLALDGMSVGKVTNKVVICDPATKPSSQQSACGAIPDSGTTLLMGPSDQIHSLYAALCDEWPRCAKTLQKGMSEGAKSKAFHDLLAKCESWMTKGDGVSEVPSVYVHLSGKEGNKQSIELSAWSYVVETTEDISDMVSTRLFGQLVKQKTSKDKAEAGKNKKVCTASFGPQDYNTPTNGPVWILGAPTFYASKVGYSVHGMKGGPGISFAEGPCGDCSSTSLLETESETHTTHKRSLRRLNGAIRNPGIDTTKPF
jgi:hypothetical protein